jgi:cell division protein FtsL
MMIISFGVCAIVSAIVLVIFYNNLVGIEHEISDTTNLIKEAHAANAELKDSIQVLLGGAELEALAASRGMVLEKKPLYIEISERWSLASRY